MEAATGGIHARTLILDEPDHLEGTQALIYIKGKALIRNQQKMFNILGDFFRAPDFTDLKRLHTVLNQVKTSIENSIPGSGHTYAARGAACSLTPGAQLREEWQGLSQYLLIKRLSQQAPEQLLDFSEQMQQLSRLVLSKENLDCSITAEQASFETIGPALTHFLTNLPERSNLPNSPTPAFQPKTLRKGWATSVPVNYVTRVFRAVPYTHPDSAALMVLAKLLRANYLHREIREKGGAYGGLASYNTEGGIFSFLSYRDPQLVRTLKVYDDAVAWAVAGEFDQTQLKEAILSIFSDLDRPLSPGGRGSHEFANICQGLTLEKRNTLRRQVLAMDHTTLITVASRYLALPNRFSSVGVIAGEATLNQANLELGDAALEIERI
jgi:Zn-dependent M16 (insulinase) family peptidase